MAARKEREGQYATDRPPSKGPEEARVGEPRAARLGEGEGEGWGEE